MAVDPALTSAFELLQQDTEQSKQELWSLFTTHKNAAPAQAPRPPVATMPPLLRLGAKADVPRKRGRPRKRKAINDDEDDNEAESKVRYEFGNSLFGDLLLDEAAKAVETGRRHCHPRS